LFLDKLRLIQLREGANGPREEAPILPRLYESTISGVKQLRGEELILSESFLGDSMKSWLWGVPGLIGTPEEHDIEQKGMRVTYQRYRTALEVRRTLEKTCGWRRPHSIERNFPHRFDEESF
jgi:hypothetical protein